MRSFFPAILAAVIAACSPGEQTNLRCDEAVVAAVRFSHAVLDDAVEARSSGDTCADAVIVLTLRAPDGRAVWAYAAPAEWVFPDALGGVIGAGAAREAMRAALTRWAQIRVTTTRDGPDFLLSEQDLGAFDSPPRAASAVPQALDQELPAGLETRFDRATFLDLRNRALPMACYETGPGSAECIYWEPGAARAALFLETSR